MISTKGRIGKTEDWQLKSRVITTMEFDPNLRKTAESIHEQISKELNDFGNPGERLSRIAFVSKTRTKAALRNDHWIRYTAHVLNTVLKHTSQEKKALQCFREVTEMMEAFKSLVTYLEKTSAVTNLPSAVIQDCRTRWNSKADMLESVSKQYPEIGQMLSDKDPLDRMKGIYQDEPEYSHRLHGSICSARRRDVPHSPFVDALVLQTKTTL